MPRGSDHEAVVITGVYGVGKSSLAQEMAHLLEKRNASYAILDLDFLGWYSTPGRQEHRADELWLTNTASVAATYRAAGVQRFLVPGSMRDRAEFEALREALDMPVRVLRLTVTLDEIGRRLAADVTTGRQDDLREAATWLAEGTGEGLEDLTIANDRPIREIAIEALDWLGWD